MEPLHRLFRKAQELGMLSTISDGCDMFRMSLYADDVAVFIKPTKHDLEVTNYILSIFTEASGLTTNLDKTQFYPIRCGQANLDFLAQNNMSLSCFPCTYLGLPLHTKKLPTSILQSLIQKIANRLPGWKRNFLTYPGRELLVKSVLSTMPTYFLTVFKMPKWGLCKIDRFRRSFLWKEEDPEHVKGGHCLVNWQACTRPKNMGGLGIKDLDKFSRALRLRWLWHH
jgi:hypothetical protein